MAWHNYNILHYIGLIRLSTKEQTSRCLQKWQAKEGVRGGGRCWQGSFHALFLIAWLADGDSLMCCIVMIGRLIARMFSTFSLWGSLFLMLTYSSETQLQTDHTAAMATYLCIQLCAGVHHKYICLSVRLFVDKINVHDSRVDSTFNSGSAFSAEHEIILRSVLQ